jgi:pimeloyl-ACP methyl ester carboxylesterase
MRQPLLTAGRREVQIVRDGDQLRLAARTVEPADAEPSWLVHADSTVDTSADDGLAGQRRLDANAARLNPAEPGVIAQRLAEVGVPSTGFDWSVDELRRGRTAVQASVSAPGAATWAPLLDAVMSIAPAVFPGQPMLRMAAHIDRVVLSPAEPPNSAIVEVSLDPHRPDVAHALVADSAGAVLASLSGLYYPVVDEPPAPDDSSTPSLSPADTDRLARMSDDERRAWVLAEVCDQVAAELRLSTSDLHPRRPLMEMGMDSILKIVIRRRLEKRFGVTLSATVFWQRPTIEGIVEHLLNQVAGGASAHTLRVPGARLHYEVAGDGPTVLLVPGGAADSTVFAGTRDTLAQHYTVVTYDPRGISLSTVDGDPPGSDRILDEHADDIHALLAEVGPAPAAVFAHSAGALTAMRHVMRHPGQVHTLVLFEPTIIGYHDAGELVGPDLPTIYREQGLAAALAKFSQLTGVEVPSPPANPSPELRRELNRMADNFGYAFQHLMPAIIDFVPDLAGLRNVAARIIVGVGEDSDQQPPHRSGLRLAADLDVPIARFPGAHMGFTHDPVEFARCLRGVLNDA